MYLSTAEHASFRIEVMGIQLCATVMLMNRITHLLKFSFFGFTFVFIKFVSGQLVMSYSFAFIYILNILLLFFV